MGNGLNDVDLLGQPSNSDSGRSRQGHSRKVLTLIATISIIIATVILDPHDFLSRSLREPRLDSLRYSPCEQADPILSEIYNTSRIWDYKDRVISWHQGIVRIPTEVTDDMGQPGQDERWEVFEDLLAWLEAAYPLIHEQLKLTKVDSYGLIYEWMGSDPSMKPIFLAGHTDVVPVLPESRPQWIEDPYGGKYDGKYIWGRGSNDDKSGITAIMAAVELLLETSDFKPTRTVILGFGHDEEAGGERGAPAIRDWMLEHYGEDSISLIVDEGSGIVQAWGTMFGTVGTAEKGRLVVNMTVNTLGGHSSVPPQHTGVGLTSLLVAALERNLYSAEIKRDNAIYHYLQCSSRFSAEMPETLRKQSVQSQSDDRALDDLPREVEKYGLGDGGVSSSPGMGNKALSLLSTTQAIDVIHGGFKVNALPEVVTVLVDHRISVHASVEEVTSHFFRTLLPIAREFGLTLSGFNQTWSPYGTPRGHVELSEGLESWLEPAPISPSELDSPAWRVVAGTSRGVYATKPVIDGLGKEGEGLIVTPFMATGNTDTRRYHALTKAIYRYKHLIDIPGSHTINERVVVDGLMEYARWYQALILNADAASDL